MEISDEQLLGELTAKRIAAQNSQDDYSKAKKEYELEKRLYQQQAIPRKDVENAAQVLTRASQSLMLSRQDLASTEKKVGGVRVVSPLDGVVVKNFVSNDEWIVNGKELVKVAQLDRFIVRGRVDELSISQVHTGQEAVVTCDAFKGEELRGRVNWIGAQAAEGAFAEIETVLDITDDKGLPLKPNLSAEAFIITGTLDKAIVIPSAAVHHGSEGAYVLRSQIGGWLIRQPVVVAKINGDQAIIERGLRAGQRVLAPQEEE